MTRRMSSRQNLGNLSRRISTSDSWALIMYQCIPQWVRVASKCGNKRQRSTKTKNLKHYKLHLQCDHIFTGRPLLSFLPLHNSVIWSSSSYNLSIPLIRSLVPYVVRMSYIVPECLVGCNAICLNSTRKCVGRNNIMVSESPKKDGIHVHM